MALTAQGQLIDGIVCYAPEIATSYADFPEEGFDVSAVHEQKSFWCRSRNRLLTMLLSKYCPIGNKVRFLEIGCGGGSVLRALRHLPQLELTGSEVYLAGLKYAKSQLPEINFIQVDATTLPFTDEFDAIGAFDVLEHIDQDVQVMEQICRALKQKGLLFITVPQYQWMWSQLDDIVAHKRRYQQSEIRAKLEKVGFSIVRSTSFVTTLFPMMVLQRFLTKSKPKSDIKEGYKSNVILPPLLNTCFDLLMRLDETVIRMGWSLPFGGTYVVVVRKN